MITRRYHHAQNDLGRCQRRGDFSNIHDFGTVPKSWRFEQSRRRWQRAIRLVVKQNRMFKIANAENAAEAERRRAIRLEAELAAASREPRAYSTPGSSHPERAPTWEPEAPSAADKAKSTVKKKELNPVWNEEFVLVADALTPRRYKPGAAVTSAGAKASARPTSC